MLTTNWDTLLERCAATLPARRYSCVATKVDIARTVRPCIVKLHSSLPSHPPLVFTEELFRQYPVSHAPFLNLARQSLLENDICLLGFSGVNPNF